ncbi:MAG: transglycosylase domain-containing protein [Chloroflexi bacterium]|nr:transglycosylase domain-containing protein [Chloroflexota bacterium]
MQQYRLEPNAQPAQSKPPRSFGRGLVTGAVAFLILAFLSLAGVIVAYAQIAADLPLPGDLAKRASSFQSTRIYDRNGELLNETFDPNEGRRVAVSLERMSPWLRQATIATEDANFYRHPGVDPVALARAVYYAVREREFVSGASTIPQQLVKLVFLTSERSAERKIKEAILAAEVSRRYSKEQILEIYLNEVYYGNLAYGVDSAAETYFGKDVGDLTLAEAALLAGLPQAPAYYDPYTFPDRVKERQAVVLRLMVAAGSITPAEADAAWLDPLAYVPVRYDFIAPHFTLYVRQQLETLLGPEALYRVGLNVTTSLDLELQNTAQAMVAEQVQALAARNVSNGALVALNPQSGEILALVGSADFDNVEIDGQVNMALAPRQPGSSIKPLVYLAAFENPERPLSERWTPGTLVADIEQEFPDGANPPYHPKNYDEKEHGILTVGANLANSYNIPAVRAMDFVGVSHFIPLAQRLGISTLTRADYGLSLALGGGEIPLLEMTGAFAVLANGGLRRPPQAILKIEDGEGNVICEIGTPIPCRLDGLAQGQQVISAVDAFLISDILSDNQARAPIFGLNSALNLGRPAAVKTGTTNDFRDALTIGYTPELVTGVWVGNASNAAMQNVSGVGGAGPIWNRFMQAALAATPASNFPVPVGVQQVEVCADTGTLPSPACPEKATRWFAADRPPLPPEADLWQIVKIDKVTGQRAGEFTPADLVEEKVFKVYPAEYREWAESHGIPQPPAEESSLFNFAPEVQITQPTEGQSVRGVISAVGVANVPSFASYELQYGISHDPGAFSEAIWGPIDQPSTGGVLGEWDTRGLTNGPHTLRLVVRDSFGNSYESRVRLFVDNLEPTVTATPTQTPTWTPTWTPMPEAATATPVILPTETPVPPLLPPQPPGGVGTIEPPSPLPTLGVSP